MDSILDDIKQVCNIDIDDTSFDRDIKLFISTSIARMHTLGFKVPSGFSIDLDPPAIWNDLTLHYDPNLQGVFQAYIIQTCQLAFDPPGNSFLVASLERQITQNTQLIEMFGGDTIV